jgi:drug/metabolite transporter (DMT)-like permease
MILLIGLLCTALLLWPGMLAARLRSRTRGHEPRDTGPEPSVPERDRAGRDGMEEAFARSVSLLLAGGVVWVLYLVVLRMAPGRTPLLLTIALAAGASIVWAAARLARRERVAAAVKSAAGWLTGTAGEKHD